MPGMQQKQTVARVFELLQEFDRASTKNPSHLNSIGSASTETPLYSAVTKLESWLFEVDANGACWSDLMDFPSFPVHALEPSEKDSVFEVCGKLIQGEVIPLLFSLIERGSQDVSTGLEEKAHNILRFSIRGHHASSLSSSSPISENLQDRSTVRLHITLLYARKCLELFPEIIDARTLGVSYGTIIGSLQGSDPQGPEVAVAICALEFVAERLKHSLLKSGDFENKEGVSMPLSAILVYGLELVPSTAVKILCRIIDDIFSGLPSAVQAQLASFFQMSILSFSDPSRRALLFQWHLGQNRARL